MRFGRTIDRLTVSISYKVWHDLLAISQKVVKNEFGVFFNYATETVNSLRDKDLVDMVIKISEIHVPQQSSNPSYFEVAPEENDDVFALYSGALHRHPVGFERFSSTDEVKVNTSFQLSGIFIPEKNFWLFRLFVTGNGVSGYVDTNTVEIDYTNYVVGSCECMLSDINSIIKPYKGSKEKLVEKFQGSPLGKHLKKQIGEIEE